MKCSYECKRMCVELYKEGGRPETPEGLKESNFRCRARKLVRMEEACGPEVLQHKEQNKRYAGLVQQIKEKSKERKNLLAEKKETPFYQITKLHDLTRRIAELTEEIEELKIEKEMLLRSLNCADGAGISAAKKEITTLEGALLHQHHHLRPLSPDRRQVRHHRLPGGAGHPPPDRGHLDPGGHGHSLRLLRQHRQPRPGQAHQRGVHRPDCQRSPPANAGGRLAGRQSRQPTRSRLA